jgi:post-segregation antitoxin (ccd killing protein)
VDTDPLHHPCTREWAGEIAAGRSGPGPVDGLLWHSRQADLHARSHQDGLLGDLLTHRATEVAVIWRSPTAAALLDTASDTGRRITMRGRSPRPCPPAVSSRNARRPSPSCATGDDVMHHLGMRKGYTPAVRTSVVIDDELAAEARRLGINLSAAAREGLRLAVQRRRAELDRQAYQLQPEAEDPAWEDAEAWGQP